jgi:hypothetical protein
VHCGCNKTRSRGKKLAYAAAAACCPDVRAFCKIILGNVDVNFIPRLLVVVEWLCTSAHQPCNMMGVHNYTFNCYFRNATTPPPKIKL